MENSIYLALSKQTVARTNMDIIANNIANMNTSGYRGQNLLFDEYISDPRGADDELSFVTGAGQYKNTDPGPLSLTGNPLDAALVGPGFFGVQGPDNQLMYSRAGQFQVDVDGTLLNSAGFAMADEGGGSIVIPGGSTEIKIDENGFVSNQDGTVGRLKVVEFANEQDLKPVGNTLYETDQAELPADNTSVQQGQAEGSNVNAITEITKMLKTLRSYQSTQNILETENDRLRNAIQKLTKQ